MNQKFSLPFLYPHTFFKLTKLYRKEQKAQKLLDEFQRGLLKKRRAALMNRELCNNNEEEINERNILIDHIILNEEKFTSDEIHDHLLTFVSGYETWAIALSHAMLLLAMNPKVQEKLVIEIQKKIKSDDDLKSSEIINGIEYLDLVQKEISRCLPVIPMVLRETLEDFEMEPGLTIPRNTHLVINFYALHRQPSIWGNDADEFRPERFSPENSVNRNPFSFLPFSSGPRICIAFKFSNISLKIAMIKLLLRFRFKTSMKKEDIRLKSYISLKLCTEHLMTIEKR
jgi:cytochrome P450